MTSIRRPEAARSARRRAALALAAAVAAGIAWRVVVATRSQPLGNDSFQYLLLARSIADGRGYVSGGSQHPDLTRPPALPVATAMASKLTGDVETAGILVSVLAGALLVLPLAALARGTFGRRAGWAAMPLAAVSCVVAASSRVLPESVFMLFAFSAAACAWRGSIARRPWLLLVSGLLGGLAALARIEGLGWIAILALWSVFGARRGTFGLRAAALVLAGGALVYVPYDAWISLRLGRWIAAPEIRYLQDMRTVAERYALRDASGPYMVWSDRSRLLLTADHGAFVLDEVFRTGAFPAADEAAPAPYGPPGVAPSALRAYHVAKRRWGILRGNLRAVPGAVRDAHLAPWAPIALAGLGVAASIRARRRRRAWVFLAALAAVSMTPLLSHVEARFLLPGFGVGLVAAAWGWGLLDAFLARRRGAAPRLLRAAVHAGLVISVAVSGWAHASIQSARLPRTVAQREAGAWAQEHLPPGPLLAVEPAIPYWSRRPYRPVPAALPDAIHAYARAAGATALAIEVRRDEYRVPALAPFLEAVPPPGFRRLSRAGNAQDDSIRFFVIEDRSH